MTILRNLKDYIIWISIFWIILIFFNSCVRDKYYEYEIINHSRSIIKVEIETNDPQFRKKIIYHINCNEKKRVFEHKPYGMYLHRDTLVPLKEKCKYFKKFSISNSFGEKSKRDFFCEGCAEFRIFFGITGQQGIFSLEITDTDFR